MSKVNVQAFDADVCMGRRNDVGGPCPKLKDVDAEVDGGFIDRLSRIEGAALKALKQGDAVTAGDFKCGICLCPLPNLDVFGQVPESCPRIAEHGGRAR